MSERKPNNTPWVVLGALLGTGLLGLFGYGFWQGFQAEKGIILSPSQPAVSILTETSNTVTIFVDEGDNMSIDRKDVSSPAEIFQYLEAFNVDDTQVIFRISDQASHTSLVEIKNGLDKIGIITKVEILRTEQ